MTAAPPLASPAPAGPGARSRPGLPARALRITRRLGARPHATAWGGWAAEAGLVTALGCLDLLVWHGQQHLRWGGTVPAWCVPALTTVSCAVLLARRAHPVPVFCWQWVHSLAGLAVPLYTPFMPLMAALYAVARYGRRLEAVAALVACLVPFGVDSANLAAMASDRSLRPVNGAVSLLLWMSVSAGVWAAGRASRAAARRERRLEQARAIEAARAVRDERLRLARELHDIVSHAVTAMILHAAGARSLLPPGHPQVVCALEAIERSGAEAVTELHRLLHLMRGQEPREPGRSAAAGCHLGERDLPALVDAARATGTQVMWSVEGSARALERSVDLTVYRIVQEALTNVAKHAGPRPWCTLALHWSPDRLDLTVWNPVPGRLARGHPATGRPAAPFAAGRQGLIGLGERVALVGGSFGAGPVEGGFLVQASLPAGRDEGGDR